MVTNDDDDDDDDDYDDKEEEEEEKEQEEEEKEQEDVFQRAFAVTKGFCLRILMCFSTTNSNGEDRTLKDVTLVNELLATYRRLVAPKSSTIPLGGIRYSA